MAFHVDVKDVKEAAAGRWDAILADLCGPHIDPRAFNRRGGRVPYPHVTCPRHGGKDDFRFKAEMPETGASICSCGKFSDGIATIQAICGWDFQETLEEVAHWLGVDQSRSRSPQERKRIERERNEARARREAELRLRDEQDRERLVRIARECVPLDDGAALPLHRYFAARRLRIDRLGGDRQYRCHPALDYFDGHTGELIGQFPALLCVVNDAQGNPVTMHRTYLTPDGEKAAGKASRKMMPYPSDREMMGGAVPILPVTSPVHNVGEGLETILSVFAALEADMEDQLAGSTCVNATMLEAYVPPAECEHLVIWADKDRSNRGLEAARKLKERVWAERKIHSIIQIPAMDIPQGAKGVDWADVWTTYGKAGFPRPKILERYHRFVCRPPPPLVRDGGFLRRVFHMNA